MKKFFLLMTAVSLFACFSFGEISLCAADLCEDEPASENNSDDGSPGVEGMGNALIAPAFIKQKTADVPIIMYHLVTNNSKYIGKHGISPAELESDLKYLKENGYETVFMIDLINFVKKGKALPKKPIVLTFDDGNSSDYLYLFPLLKKYDMKAVLAVMGKVTDEYTEMNKDKSGTARFPYLTWEQIEEMHDSRHVEIQSHSYDLHKIPLGSARKSGESTESYAKRLNEDLQKMQKCVKKATGREPNTFVYPLGAVPKGSREILEEMGFSATLSCWSGINRLTENDPDCLFKMRRSNRPHGVPIESLLNKMQKPE